MTSAAKMARALAARELAQCPIDWSMIERDRQMTSDVKPATDYEISGIKAAMPDHFYQKHRMLADMGLLLARISADAARIRELEAALCACADDLEAELNNRYPPAIRKYPCMEIDYQRDMHSVHEARAMLAAAPRP